MRSILVLLALLLIGSAVEADEVDFTAKAPNVVRQGQQFRLTYTVNSQAGDFNPPDLSPFDVLAGPSTSSSTNVSIINGKMTRKYRQTYTYVLQASETGKYTLSPAQVEVDGQTYQSNALTIEVIKQKQGSGGQKQSSPSQAQKGKTKEVQAPGDDLFVKVLVDKDRVYQAEPLVATIKLYSKLNISGLENVKFPAFEGFYKQEIETPTLRQLEKENVNGQIYGTGILKKYLLFPQKSGQLTIGSFQVDCIVQKKVEGKSRSIFDDFFGSYRNVRMSVESEPVGVQVRPLPSGAPRHFSGGVGSFQIDAKLDKQQVKVNEGVSLTLEVSGRGNLKVMDHPSVEFAPDLEVYDPKVSNNIEVSQRGARGTKTIEYLIIPRHAGEYRIPPVRMSYFDLDQQAYLTRQTEPLTLQAKPAAGDTTTGGRRSYARQDVSIIGSDIRYIQTDGFDLKEKNTFVFGSPGFYLTYAGGLAAFFVVLFFRRRKAKESADLALLKQRKANKFARKRLKAASRYLKQDNKDQFYEETLKALWGYMSDKLGIPIADLSRDHVRGKLQEREIPEELISRFVDLIDNCEYARYAPASQSGGMEQFYREALSTITALQQKLK